MRLTIELDDSLHRALKIRCVSNKVSMGSEIQRLIREVLEREARTPLSPTAGSRCSTAVAQPISHGVTYDPATHHVVDGKVMPR